MATAWTGQVGGNIFVRFLALPAGVQGMHESVIDMFNQQAYYV